MSARPLPKVVTLHKPERHSARSGGALKAVESKTHASPDTEMPRYQLERIAGNRIVAYALIAFFWATYLVVAQLMGWPA